MNEINNSEKNKLAIYLLFSFIVAIEVYYILSFISKGLMSHYGYKISSLSSIFYPTVLLFFISMIVICLSIIMYGLLHRKLWTRKFSIMFLLWSMLFPIWGIIVGNQVFEHSLLILVYGLSIIVLMSNFVKQYFLNICTYRKYTLYKRFVMLRNGRICLIRFFSKKIPNYALPCNLPIGFEIKVNNRSKMPYLRKIGFHPYQYKKYTLYMRIVKLKNGLKLPIYFFAKNKPKSGIPAQLPNKYQVKENQRSHMPYLIRKKPGFH